MRGWVTALLICLGSGATAQSPDLTAIVENHVLPGYRQLAAATRNLASTAESECATDSVALRRAYHEAFDAWIAVSHLRFGPSEAEDRAFALAFWPDMRGATPKALGRLIRDEDPVITDRQGFRTVSVAARGFHALEFMLFDPRFTETADTGYRCALLRAMTVDIAESAGAILVGWEGGYAALMANPGNETYRSHSEAIRQVFTALVTGLEFTSDARLARPMGTIERPRPNRAEARRSGRSLRHVILSLEATRDLARLISDGDAGLDDSFVGAIDRANDLEDPVFAGVLNPQGRLRVESLRQYVDSIRRRLNRDLGPRLGIAAGFNSLDGD
ncbi:MAG: imelysin family protein [Rhodobacter sp.]|nr:imelysin family protein [Rhodobacter sp.]